MRIVLNAAMDEEATPLLPLMDAHQAWEWGRARAWTGTIGTHEVTLVRSGIGLVNAAAAVTSALHRSDADAVICIGTCGGLAGQVGDIVAGAEYRFNGADATLFGYELGQVPGMPPFYVADAALLERARQLSGLTSSGLSATQVHSGPVLSGDSFIASHNIAAVRSIFPGAVAADMESTAVAQVCHNAGVAFCSVRVISDMCDLTEATRTEFSREEIFDRAARVAAALVAAI